MGDITIDGTAISGCTIDGTTVQSIDVDGVTVWQNKVLVTNKTAASTYGDTSMGNYSHVGGWTTGNNSGSGSYLQQGNGGWSYGAAGIVFFDWNSFKTWFDGYANNPDIENCRVTKLYLRWDRWDWDSGANRTANIFLCDRTGRSGTPTYYGPDYNSGNSGLTHAGTSTFNNNYTTDQYGYNPTAELGIGYEYTTMTNGNIMNKWQTGTCKSVAFMSTYNTAGNNYATYLFVYSTTIQITVTITYDQWETP